MKVSEPVRVALISLGLLTVACDNGTPMFQENVAGVYAGSTAGNESGDGPGQDATREGYDGENPLDDTTPADRGEIPPVATSPQLTSWTFQASTIESGDLRYTASNRLISQDIAMDGAVSQAEKIFTQIDRPMLTETHAQGSVHQRQSEIFRQNGSAQGALDLLVVVDNSGSMKEEQENLSTKLSPLLSYVKDSDWRIGVVTTDPNDGCLRSLIQKSDRNTDAAFSQAVSAGIQGSGNERGILQAVNGLKGQCNPAGSWLRAQSTVAVLVVSDEDNCSAGKDCGQEAWASGAYLTDYLSTIRQPGINARVYGLIGHPSLSSQQCKTMAAKAHIYADVIDRTGGSWGSICASDYSGTLQAISKDISAILLTQFTLQYQPVSESVKVYLDGKLQGSGYKVSGNVIEFAEAPKAGSVVSFDYEFVAEAPKTEFLLSEKAVASSIVVALDGVETKAFTFDSQRGAVKFSSAPKAKSIRIVYRRADELPKSFQVDKELLTSSLKVKVGDVSVAQTSYTYDHASGVLSFKSAPSDKSVISIQGTKVLSKALTYPLHIGLGDVGGLSAWDASTGKSVPAKFEKGEVRFSEADYQPGRKVLIKGLSPSNWKVPLDGSVLADTLKVSSLGAGCEAWSLNGSEVDLSPCSFKSGVEVKLSFDFERERRDVFELEIPEGLEESRAKWVVKINGVETKEYTISSGRLFLNGLPLKAVVEVSLEASAVM